MAHDVFITYSAQDKPYADAICNGLESNGIRCWVAPRDIVPGTNWPAAVLTAIRQSRVMLLVFSRHSNASRQVLREIERAVNGGLMVIPVRIEDAQPSESMEFFLGVPHWLDAITPPIEQHIKRMVSVVGSLLGTDTEPLAARAADSTLTASRHADPTGKSISQYVRRHQRRAWVAGAALAAAAFLFVAWTQLRPRASVQRPAPAGLVPYSPTSDDSVYSPADQAGSGARPEDRAAAATPARVLATVAVPENSSWHVAVNSTLNKIYVSGGASGNQQVTVIDGRTHSSETIGVGSGTSIDVATSRYWSAGVYSPAAAVARDGRTNEVVATVPLRGCPISTTVDAVNRRVWVSAQCADYIAVIHADSFEEIIQFPSGV
ncbi:MAG: TIR domain-containing protein [Gemmatimonadaceae bacterium]